MGCFPDARLTFGGFASAGTTGEKNVRGFKSAPYKYIIYSAEILSREKGMTSFRVHRFCLLLFVLLLSTQSALTQQKLNLDFETLSVEGLSRPWGWSVYLYAPNVTFVCDTSITFSGKHSLRIQNGRKNDNSRFEFSFFIEPNQILNSEITVEGWAKSEDFVGSSGINLKSIGTVGEAFGTLQESETEIQNSKGWEKYKTGINIGSQAHSVLVTLYFEGSGTVWFDNLQLKVDNKIVNEIPVASRFSKEQQEFLAKEVSIFTTVEPSSETNLKKSDFEDLKFIKSLVGDAHIIALGESTHGTSEFFKVKHRLLQYAILELGVHTLVLEDNQLLVEKVNDYVLYGKGEAETVIKGLFAVWNTKEMLELIKWLRSYNRSHPDDMVEFVGMDVQNPQLALEHLYDFLRQKDTTFQNNSNKLLADIRRDWRDSYIKTDSILSKWDRDAEANFNLVLGGKDKWLNESRNTSDSLAVEWAIKNARTIKQFTEIRLGDRYEGRDKAMAENVEWIVNHRKQGTKIIVWAHDSHISRGDAPEAASNFSMGNSMGSYLSKKYKDNYCALGLFTYQGTCLGTISYSNFAQSPFEIYTSPEGSLDEALHSISLNLDKPNLILNLKPFKNESKEFAWMNIKRPVRYVGYVAEDYGFGGRYQIPYQFDGIIFIDNSRASTTID